MGWEEVNPDEDVSPFGGIAPVDGLVYEVDESSPELRYQPPTVVVPPPPQRRPPVPPSMQSVDPWRPGGEVDVAQVRRPRRAPAVVKVLLLGSVPLVFLLAVLAGVMALYGRL